MASNAVDIACEQDSSTFSNAGTSYAVTIAHTRDYQISSTFYNISEYRTFARPGHQSTNVPSDSLALSHWKIHDVRSIWKWLSTFTTGFWLVKLPNEPRKMIFELVFKEQVWSGKTVPLIIALRPHPGMYREALDVFFKQETSVYRLWLPKLNQSLKMGKSAAKGTQRIEISCGVITPTQVKKIFSGGATFTHVTLKFSFTKNEIETTLLTWIHAVLRLSPHLRSIAVRFPEHFKGLGQPSIREQYQAELAQWKIDYQQWKQDKFWGVYYIRPAPPIKPRAASLAIFLSDRLGVPGTRVTKVYPACPKFTYDGGPDKDTPWGKNWEWNHEERTWSWEVEVGKVLVWTEEGNGSEDQEMTG